MKLSIFQHLQFLYQTFDVSVIDPLELALEQTPPNQLAWFSLVSLRSSQFGVKCASDLGFVYVCFQCGPFSSMINCSIIWQ